MIMKCYAIKDKKAGFGIPIFEPNDAAAMRNFEFAVKRGDSVLSTHAHDFCLCYIGTYDTDLGLIAGDNYKVIIEGVDCLER